MIVVRIKAILVVHTTDEYVVVSSFEALALVINNPVLPLECVLCIHHSVQFKRDQIEIQALLDFRSKVHYITPVYAAKLGLKV